MRPRGRTSCVAATLHAVFLLTHVSYTSSDAGVPIEIKLWDSGRSPLSHMVDVTNEFGLKVLAEHNFLNDNNIAFSPYGLVGILVALFEGVDGESSYQLQQGMQLPWSRNVMRVGFRDIHRTLKTYFVPEEGFLAGLALNNENVTFNDAYKNILRFYGFDLDNDQLPTSTSAPSETTVTTVSTTISEGTTIAMSTEAIPREDTTTTRDPSSTNANAETISEVDIREPSMSTPGVTFSAPNTETTQTSTDGDQTEIRSTDTTLQTTPTTTADIPSSTTTSTMTTEMSTPSTVVMETTAESTLAPMTNEPSVTNNVETVTTSLVTSTMNGASTAAESVTTTIEPATVESTMSETSTDQTNTETSSGSDATTTSTIETLQRKKKSIVDFIYTNPVYLDDYLYLRSFDVGSQLPDSVRGSNNMFLVNGLRRVQVTYMHYDSILQHAYLPHLEAAALRLPLDSDRYYLLVVLPSRGGAAELGRLLGRMARESDLADVYAALRPRRVRAVVPSFIVKGHVTLTTDLQKLGIRDVFEPRQRDFTPMTRQSGVYVRSIEQAVSVAIRKYQPEDHNKNRYVVNQQPVRFSATYPFLYFVMDANIHVALMAGKMVDPLNTRIL